MNNNNNKIKQNHYKDKLKNWNEKKHNNKLKQKIWNNKRNNKKNICYNNNKISINRFIIN